MSKRWVFHLLKLTLAHNNGIMYTYKCHKDVEGE